MNREEAQIYIRDLLTGHNEECTTNHYWDVANGIDKIFDDFESRTCANCRWYNGTYCLESDLIQKFDGMVEHKDFGCNKWEVNNDMP